MSASSVKRRYLQCMRGEIKLEMSGYWINQLFNMDVPLEDNCQYIVGMLECRMCEDRSMMAWPLDVLDEDAMECGNCGHMTCEPVAEDLIEIKVVPRAADL